MLYCCTILQDFVTIVYILVIGHYCYFSYTHYYQTIQKTSKLYSKHAEKVLEKKIKMCPVYFQDILFFHDIDSNPKHKFTKFLCYKK